MNLTASHCIHFTTFSLSFKNLPWVLWCPIFLSYRLQFTVQKVVLDLSFLCLLLQTNVKLIRNRHVLYDVDSFSLSVFYQGWFSKVSVFYHQTQYNVRRVECHLTTLNVYALKTYNCDTFLNTLVIFKNIISYNIDPFKQFLYSLD